MGPKLQDCISTDKWRESINYVLVTKEETVATDRHILVVHKTEELFSKEFADSLPEDGILLDKEALKSISKISFMDISYDNKNKLVGLVHGTPKTDLVTLYFPVKLNKAKLTFPEYACLFDGKDKWDGDEVEIGINPQLLNRLGNGMGCNPGLRLKITGRTRAIFAYNTGASAWPSAKGLIMPFDL